MSTALLLSGGMDSTCLAYWKRPDFAFTINYGQKAVAGELRAAQAVADTLGIPLSVIVADIAALGSGDMAGGPASVDAPASEWWPYRNQFLLTVAAMQCHKVGADRLLIGALRTDGFHVDGTPHFIDQINLLFAMQEGDLVAEAPAIELSAPELILTSGIPLSVLAWSHSCHVADYACGFCRGCQKHYESMEQVFGQPY